MHARSTTIQATPSAIDEGIDYLREAVLPALLRMNGCLGLSLLVDRETGLCIATSSWDTQEHMRASAASVQAVRDEGTTAFGGTVSDVEEWEIAVLHREHTTQVGSCVRVSWLKGAPEQMAQAIAAFRDTVLPGAEQLPGFCSASLLVDPATGRFVGSTAWDSRAALEGSRTAADQLRASTAGAFAGQIQGVHEFELVIAHLRVPELA